MRSKGGKEPRPRFHCYFPIELVTSAAHYIDLKKAARQVFPYFDAGALDAARFFFGAEATGETFTLEEEDTLTGFLQSMGVMIQAKAARSVVARTQAKVSQPVAVMGDQVIAEGLRNTTLSHRAGKILKRHGDAKRAHATFLATAAKCEPALDENELETIFKSAQKFYLQKIITDPAYIPPAEYDGDVKTLKPPYYTEKREARVLAQEYTHKLRYCSKMGYLVYDGKVWEVNEESARNCLHELTDRQIIEITPELIAAKKNLEMAEDKEKAKQEYKAGLAYLKFILKCEDSSDIAGIYKIAQTLLAIKMVDLDADGYSLNTPGFEVDLRTGEMKPHNLRSFHTKIAAVTPSTEGAELWQDFIRFITCGRRDLVNYLQMIAGEILIGEVSRENLIIAYGKGSNGKSTYCNTLSRIMGDYSGQISAETLTTGRKDGKNWEVAELRGKRLIIAPELEEGTRLDAAFVKKICSTDKILGEQKYQKPFSFVPSHTTVLYTNHLPRVGQRDAGTWRRLVVLPFDAVVEGKDDIKNYADHLYRHAGSAALAWMIEGAKRFFEADGRISLPACVKQANDSYRATNDWLSEFIAECCEVGGAYKEQSSRLYQEYSNYCARTGNYTRSARDFKAALEGEKFETRHTEKGTFYYGLHLKSDFG